MKKLEENLAKHEKQMSQLTNHAKKSYNHRAHGDYNAELLYSPPKIILIEDIIGRDKETIDCKRFRDLMYT